MSLGVATGAYTDEAIDAAITDAYARVNDSMQARARINGNNSHDINSIKEVVSAIGFLMKREKHRLHSPQEAARWLAIKRNERMHNLALPEEQRIDGGVGIDCLAEALGIHSVMMGEYVVLSPASGRVV